MAQWLTDNAGNMIVIAILLIIVYLSIRSMIKAKKSGKGSCGCGCAHCAMSGKCHERAEKLRPKRIKNSE